MINPASGFVEQLSPNTLGDGIPCHAIRSVLLDFIEPGGPTAIQLGEILEREFVPGGWTAQDNIDNAALIALINTKGTYLEKLVIALQAEGLCMLWEKDVDETNTPAKYRARLGIAP